MAQKTVVTKYLTDDMDGTEAVETIVFGIDNKTYEIDLNKRNAAAMRKALKPYLTSGRRLRMKRAPSTGTTYQDLSKEDRLRVRAWAGLSSRGRVNDEIVATWIAGGRK